jgi:hypothetical protein
MSLVEVGRRDHDSGVLPELGDHRPPKQVHSPGLLQYGSGSTMSWLAARRRELADFFVGLMFGACQRGQHMSVRSSAVPLAWLQDRAAALIEQCPGRSTTS